MDLIGMMAASALGLAGSVFEAGAEKAAVQTYSAPGGQALSAHVFASDASEPAPAILLFHGGGWRHGSPAWVTGTAKRFAENGAVAIAIEYRLSKDGVTPVQAFEDSCAALAWTRDNADELGIDENRIGAYGVSAGGHLAASTATVGCADETAGPDLLVLYSPAVKTSQDGWFQRLLGDAFAAAAYSPVEHVSERTPPTLIVSGEADTLTPHRHAEEYCARLDRFGTECEIVAFEDVGHLLTRNLENQESDFDVAPEDGERARHAISGFLARHGYSAPAAD